MHRLSNASLSLLPKEVERPSYDRARLSTGIVHLGVGAFHRAHQALMTEAVLASGDLRWGIVAASLRSPDTRDALAPQDGLYAVAVRDGSGTKTSVVGAIQRLIVGPLETEALLRAMCEPSVKIVSLTVTEKGYCHDPATGALDPNHPDILRDLAHPAQPVSAPGYIVEALSRRRQAGLPPFAVLCCDNLPANGHTVRRVVAGLARLRDAALARHIEDHVAFPSTMVDRIVPATTDADRASVAATLRLQDAWPVVAEPFAQWIVEDNFPQGRPDWTLAGAQFVREVAPFELMKLRMLNGAHSCLAYLGYLAGFVTVSDACSAAPFARYLRDLWAEIMPTIPAPPGVDLNKYADALLLRFRNTAIRHRLWQIAMDGSQKLPQRLLGTIKDRLEAGETVRNLMLGVAGWCRYVAGTDEKNGAIDVRDPEAARLRACLAGFQDRPEDAIRRLLACENIFGSALAKNRVFANGLTQEFVGLLKHGALASISRS